MVPDATPQDARMELEPDAFHEADEGFYVDCPECGNPAFLTDVIEKGRCRGYLGDPDAATENVDHEPTCSAELSLELVWES